MTVLSRQRLLQTPWLLQQLARRPIYLQRLTAISGHQLLVKSTFLKPSRGHSSHCMRAHCQAGRRRTKPISRSELIIGNDRFARRLRAIYRINDVIGG
ncbi:hypothetical protein RRG08_030186 [Elysia crispata]|uniref:Uncharacterized protein n=1 Tax=Elysia crispata TaxID=231223 RepID=A0AAE1DKI2_9GAST|nr:hypothetical protein RRG08_030186 [Elysia crispata]